MNVQFVWGWKLSLALARRASPPLSLPPWQGVPCPCLALPASLCQGSRPRLDSPRLASTSYPWPDTSGGLAPDMPPRALSSLASVVPTPRRDMGTATL